jgi:NifU-like protein involved in Fe-S cluster formation/TusA-related sulfurtransferase
MLDPLRDVDALPGTVSVWDAGDLSCGELVLELRTRLAVMPSQMLRVIALDPGAPEDIPAWCRLTGHVLVRQDEATSSYWIRARGEEAASAAAPAEDGATRLGSAVDAIYSPKVFQLARSLPSASRLAAPDATAEAQSKLCGSAIAVDIIVLEGKVNAYAQRVKACLFGRASAAIVAREIVGTPAAEILQISSEMRAMLEKNGPAPGGRWADLAALAPMRTLKARHASALLVFVALERAIAGLPARR